MRVPPAPFLLAPDELQRRIDRGEQSKWACKSFCSVDTDANGKLFVPPGLFQHPDLPKASCTCQDRGADSHWSCSWCEIEDADGSVSVVPPGAFEHPEFPDMTCTCGDEGSESPWKCVMGGLPSISPAGRRMVPGGATPSLKP